MIQGGHNGHRDTFGAARLNQAGGCIHAREVAEGTGYHHPMGGRLRTVVFDEERATRETAIRQLPLVTLYLSERCNSRCLTCD